MAASFYLLLWGKISVPYTTGSVGGARGRVSGSRVE